MSNNKYKAKKVYWDIRNHCVLTSENSVKDAKAVFGSKYKAYYIPFDSIFECQVYQLLIQAYGTESVQCQYPVEIIPPSICYPKGKFWNCDFAVMFPPTLKKPFKLVEAKGLILNSFNDTLAHCEQRQKPLFSRLDIVFRDVPKNKQVIKNLSRSSLGAKVYSLSGYERYLSEHG